MFDPQLITQFGMLAIMTLQMAATLYRDDHN